MVKLARTRGEVSRGLDGESWSVLIWKMSSLQQDAFHDQSMCAPHVTALGHGESEMPWANQNTLKGSSSDSVTAREKGERCFCFLFYLLWWQNKCILECFSELMLQGFFMTSTTTRDQAKANWCFRRRNCIPCCQRTKRLWWLFLKPYQKCDSLRAI